MKKPKSKSKKKPPVESQPLEMDADSELRVPIQDVVLSNSWALQAILDYLDEQDPGARDRIWEKYRVMKAMVEADSSGVKPS